MQVAFEYLYKEDEGHDQPHIFKSILPMPFYKHRKMFEEAFKEVVAWCVEHFGEEQHSGFVGDRWTNDGSWIWIRDDKDAILFRLNWSVRNEG